MLVAPMSTPEDVGPLADAGEEEEEGAPHASANHANGTLVLHGSAATADSSSEEEEDSDSDDFDRAPPKDIGDVDPAKCKASGPGFSGSGACAPVSLYLYAHDHYSRRLQKGGDEVVVRVSPASSSSTAAPIEATVRRSCRSGAWVGFAWNGQMCEMFFRHAQGLGLHAK